MKRRWIWLLALALGVTILFTLLAAPSNSKLNSGSTYSRAPDGYGAWYAFMEKQGIPVKRWQKPFEDLPGVKGGSKNPITLLRVYSQLGDAYLYEKEREWVEKSGNTLVILGVRQPVTAANFSTRQSSSVGAVKIETQRRNKQLREGEKSLLGDRFGVVVWQEKLGKGRVIRAATPYLAANAYQDEPGNYKFLAQLVTQPSAEEQGKTVGTVLADSNWGRQITFLQNPSSSERKNPSKIQNQIWVDEYIHGYKDNETKNQEGQGNWISYLAKTPLASIFVQAGVILLVLVLAQNRRFGQPLTLSAPAIDNSEAYIQALAGVLQKANSSEFVLEVLGKEEQLQMQKALALGSTPVDRETLINAWTQQTGRPAAELEQVLQFQSKKRRISEQDLLTWLGKWQTLRSHLS